MCVKRLDGHMALANSLALKLAGITRDTKDPPGGTIVRDAAGEPTGIVKDNAWDLVPRVDPRALPGDEPAGGAGRARGGGAGRASPRSRTTRRSTPCPPTRTCAPAASSPRASTCGGRSPPCEPLAQSGVRTGLGDDWIRLGALKILSDGAMGSGTAAFFEPYADDPKTSGLLLYPVPELSEMILEADAGGYPARRPRDRRPRQQPRPRRFRDGGGGATARATGACGSSTPRSCARRTSPATRPSA